MYWLLTSSTFPKAPLLWQNIIISLFKCQTFSNVFASRKRTSVTTVDGFLFFSPRGNCCLDLFKPFSVLCSKLEPRTCDLFFFSFLHLPTTWFAANNSSHVSHPSGKVNTVKHDSSISVSGESKAGSENLVS